MAMWVFGYGSLVWNPGFEAQECALATLSGYARSFCMHSIHHRGTQEEPGLVLALDEMPQSACRGVAFCVQDGEEGAVLSYLRERELVSSAYLEKQLLLGLDDGRQVQAVTYVIDTDHVQYCGGMPLEQQARIIAEAVGGRGPNDEYLFQTHSHLVELGIKDPDLDWLVKRVRDLRA